MEELWKELKQALINGVYCPTCGAFPKQECHNDRTKTSPHKARSYGIGELLQKAYLKGYHDGVNAPRKDKK